MWRVERSAHWSVCQWHHISQTPEVSQKHRQVVVAVTGEKEVDSSLGVVGTPGLCSLDCTLTLGLWPVPATVGPRC